MVVLVMIAIIYSVLTMCQAQPNIGYLTDHTHTHTQSDIGNSIILALEMKKLPFIQGHTLRGRNKNLTAEI